MNKRPKALAETLHIERRDAAWAWPEIESLTKLVYTPEMWADFEFPDVDWSHAEHWVLGYRDGVLVGSAGIHRREGQVDGKTVTIAGIGGVKTHPDHQKRGYASAILDNAIALIEETIAPTFSLIFVESHNRDFYEKRGWRVFEGKVVVEQPAGYLNFPDKRTMVRDGAKPAPRSGTIDLRGKPW